MSYTVEFYADGLRLATGIADATNRISDIKPIEGRGLSCGRRVQITVNDGRHVGACITGQIKTDQGDAITLMEAMPFQEKS
jgi:hypothetical protein